MCRHLIYDGACYRLEGAVLPDESCEICDFLDGQSESDRQKLRVLFERLGDAGRISNREKFKKVRGDIWAFKSFQIRIFCFFTKDRRVILLYGLKKKTDKYKPREIDRADQLRDIWLASRANPRS